MIPLSDLLLTLVNIRSQSPDPATVNAHITALDHFYEHLGLGPVKIRRDAAPKLAP